MGTKYTGFSSERLGGLCTGLLAPCNTGFGGCRVSLIRWSVLCARWFSPSSSAPRLYAAPAAALTRRCQVPSPSSSPLRRHPPPSPTTIRSGSTYYTDTAVRRTRAPRAAGRLRGPSFDARLVPAFHCSPRSTCRLHLGVFPWCPSFLAHFFLQVAKLVNMQCGFSGCRWQCCLRTFAAFLIAYRNTKTICFTCCVKCTLSCSIVFPRTWKG